MTISPNRVRLEDRFMQSSRYTGLPTDERGTRAELVARCTVGDVVPDGVAELLFWAAVDVKGLVIGEEIEAPVAALCKEVAAPVVDDVPEAVVVFKAVSTAKPCC